MDYKDVSSDIKIIELRDRLDDIKLKGLESYKVGTILSVPLFLSGTEDISNIKVLKSMIKSCFFLDYNTFGEDCEIIYFESVDYYDAVNYRKMYKTMVDTIGTGMKIEAIRKCHIDYKIFEYIYLYNRWKNKIYKLYPKKKLSKYLALHLVRAYIELKKFQRITEGYEYRSVVTLCDVHPVDAMITQFVKMMDKTTITLQHGHFNAKDRGWVYHQSCSDYFLLHGEYARQEAIKSNHNKEGLIPIGMPNFIGIKRHTVRFDVEKKIFALILNGPGAKEDNSGFIECANQFAKTYNMKYIVRSHPVIHIDMYSSLIDKKYLERVSGKDERLSKLFECVQFVLVGNSTVFIEALYLGMLTFRYIGKSQDIYEGINWCAFHDEDELGEIYAMLTKDIKFLEKKIGETTDYLCQSGDIGENYKRFFEKLRGRERNEGSRDNTSTL